MNLACLDILGTYRDWTQPVMAAPENNIMRGLGRSTGGSEREAISSKFKDDREPTACHRGLTDGAVLIVLNPCP
jgi:hypothetical protein